MHNDKLAGSLQPPHLSPHLSPVLKLNLYHCRIRSQFKFPMVDAKLMDGADGNPVVEVPLDGELWFSVSPLPCIQFCETTSSFHATTCHLQTNKQTSQLQTSTHTSVLLPPALSYSGTKYDLKSGDVLEWAPQGGNPLQGFLNNLKKAEEAKPLAVYPTQVSFYCCSQ